MTGGLTLDDPAYFDRLALADRSHWWPAAMWGIASHWLSRAIRGCANLDALDVGCGAGWTLERLARLPQVARVVGMDPSREAISHARPRSRGLLRADALRLPFAASRFDVVTCFDVLQHLPEGGDRIAACELRRVVRPGGVVLVRANGRGLWPDPAVSARLYSLSELIDVLRSARLAIVQASYVNCLPALASEVAGRLRGTPGSGHPAGRGLRIDTPSPWRDRAMKLVSGAETFVAGRLGGRLPMGHSTMVLARRPAAGESS